MERRYNIVDDEDLANARELLERRPTVVENVVVSENPAKLGDTATP
jgi:hypothetical protein